jgi:hypothetical protein
MMHKKHDSNKITKSLDVKAGTATEGRTYGRDWGTYQAVGGYKAEPDDRNTTPSDPRQNDNYMRKVESFSSSRHISSNVDVKAGSFTRGGFKR